LALALSLASLSYRTEWIGIWADPATCPADVLAASPFAKVPLLVSDGVAQMQSQAILLDIANRFRCLGDEPPEGTRRGVSF
jgi:glutathione S-transferase